MDWSSILSGAIGGGIVAIGGNIFLKYVDFHYDYKKYVFEQRKIAYKEAEKVINELLIKTHYTKKENIESGLNEEVYVYEINFLKNRTAIGDYLDNISKLMEYNFWFTDKFYKLVIKLHNEIDFYYNEFDKMQKLTEISGIGNRMLNEESLDNIYNDLSKQYVLDIKNLNSSKFIVKT